MLGSKNPLRILQRTKCISIPSGNRIIAENFPKHFHTVKKIEPNKNLYATNFGTTQFCRNYAKGKDKKKEKGSTIFQINTVFLICKFSGKAKVVINENLLAEVVNIDTIKNQMQKAIDQLKEDFVKHISLRSTTG